MFVHPFRIVYGNCGGISLYSCREALLFMMNRSPDEMLVVIQHSHKSPSDHHEPSVELFRRIISKLNKSLNCIASYWIRAMLVRSMGIHLAAHVLKSILQPMLNIVQPIYFDLQNTWTVRIIFSCYYPKIRAQVKNYPLSHPSKNQVSKHKQKKRLDKFEIDPRLKIPFTAYIKL